MFIYVYNIYKSAFSVLGNFRQFYLDKVTVSATGMLLQSSWNCWAATGWGTLRPETAQNCQIPEQEVDRWLSWFNSSWKQSLMQPLIYSPLV